MNEQWLRREIEKDLQRAAAGRGVVCYLEGKTDVPILLGLLGARDEGEVSGGVLHEGVLIRGLRDGSGSSAVKQRLEVAGRHGYPGIFGVLDGDGEARSTLAAAFDAPHPGPCYRWKAYCIENLLAGAVWPAAWGAVPEWRVVLADYAPYVAINRLGTELRRRLQRLELDRFISPGNARPLRTTGEFLAMLAEGQHALGNLEIAAMFSTEVEGYMATLGHSLEDAHALLNGKWLVGCFAPRRTGRSARECRDEWTEALRFAGGDPEIGAWWARAVLAAERSRAR